MKYILYITILLLCTVACQNSASPEPEQQLVTVTEDQLVEFNKAMIAEENDHIDAFVLRYQWNTLTTETGVHYWVYENGNGVKIKTGDILQCAYTLKLITGDEIYNSDSDGPLIFKIGKSDQPSGLEEVLLLLRQGDRAKVVVPSYLAHGLAGDNDKIPSAATLVYDIHIEKIIEPQSIK